MPANNGLADGGMYNITNTPGQESNDNITAGYYNYYDYSEYDNYLYKLIIIIKETVSSLRILRMVVCSLGAVLNVSSIIMLLKSKWRGKTIFRLLISISVSDLLLAVLHFAMVFIDVPTVWEVGRVIGSWKHFNNIGIVLSFIYFIPQTAGLVNMYALAVDLLIAVKKPLQHRHLMSARRVNILLICIWVVPTVACLAAGICNVYVDSNGLIGLAITSVTAILTTISFIVFVVLYMIIYCGIRSAAANFPRQRSRSLKKATITTLLIVVTYAICMTPLSLTLFIHILLELDIVSGSNTYLVLVYTLPELLQCLFILNTVCDPLIYAVRIREVRETYMATLRKCQWTRRAGTRGTDV